MTNIIILRKVFGTTFVRKYMYLEGVKVCNGKGGKEPLLKGLFLLKLLKLITF